MLDRSTHAAGATALLVALFCAFFWLGFLAGKHSSARRVAYPMPVSPAGERVEWRGAVNHQINKSLNQVSRQTQRLVASEYHITPLHMLMPCGSGSCLVNWTLASSLPSLGSIL